MPKKLPELKFTYHYKEPKTPEEKAEADRNLAAAYDILFEEVLRQRRSSDPDHLKELGKPL